MPWAGIEFVASSSSSDTAERAVRDSHCRGATRQRLLVAGYGRGVVPGRRWARGTGGGEHDTPHRGVCKARQRRQPGNLDHQRPQPSVKCSPSDRVDRDWQRRFRTGGVAVPRVRRESLERAVRNPRAALARPAPPLCQPGPLSEPGSRRPKKISWPIQANAIATPPRQALSFLPSTLFIYASHRPRRTTTPQ